MAFTWPCFFIELWFPLSDASSDLSDYCLPKDPEEEWHPTRYLRHQLSSSSSSQLAAAGLSNAVNMATRILSSSSGCSSGGRSSLGSSTGNSPSLHGSNSSSGPNSASGNNSSSTSGLNSSRGSSGNFGRDAMDFSPSPVSPELDLWHQSGANNSLGNYGNNSSSLGGSSYPYPMHHPQHQGGQKRHSSHQNYHRRPSSSSFDQSFEAIVKQHHASFAAGTSAHQNHHQLQQQQQPPPVPKEHFFQNLYVNELKKSQDLMQQGKDRKPSLPHGLSPEVAGSQKPGFATPPAFALTPPLMAPKKSQVIISSH